MTNPILFGWQQQPPHGRLGTCPLMSRPRDRSGSESADTRPPSIPPSVPCLLRRRLSSTEPLCSRGSCIAATCTCADRAHARAAAGRHCSPPPFCPPPLARQRMPARGQGTHAPLPAIPVALPGAVTVAPLCSAALEPGSGGSGNAAQMSSTEELRSHASACPDMAPARSGGVACREPPHGEIRLDVGSPLAAPKAIPVGGTEREREAGLTSQHVGAGCSRHSEAIDRGHEPWLLAELENLARGGPGWAPARRNGGAI